MRQPWNSAIRGRDRHSRFPVLYPQSCWISWVACGTAAAIMGNQNDTQGHSSWGWGAPSAAFGCGPGTELAPEFHSEQLHPEQPGSAFGSLRSENAADAAAEAGALSVSAQQRP